MNYLIVYGSLRKYSKKGYNFDRFGVASQTFLRNIILDGFELYDTGFGYPAVCKGDGFVRAELHTVTDKAFEQIKKMELNSSYKEIKFDKSLTNASLFVMDKNKLTNCKKIDSGNWG